MCGIIVYLGPPLAVRELIRFAIGNRHRGCDDGFGFVNLETGEITKSQHILEDLGAEMAGKSERTMDVHDKLDQKSSKWLVHHRQSTFGENCDANTHPIILSEGTWYVHNGTCTAFKGKPEAWQERRAESDYPFEGTTDSEFLARFSEEERDEGLLDEDIYERLKENFGSWGVLIGKHPGKDALIIYKTSINPLYLLEFREARLLITEPLSSMTGANRCTELVEGVFTFPLDGSPLESSDPEGLVDRTARLHAARGRTFTIQKCETHGKHFRHLEADGEQRCLICHLSEDELPYRTPAEVPEEPDHFAATAAFDPMTESRRTPRSVEWIK